jgi:hypothetical protein
MVRVLAGNVHGLSDPGGESSLFTPNDTGNHKSLQIFCQVQYRTMCHYITISIFNHKLISHTLLLSLSLSL